MRRPVAGKSGFYEPRCRFYTFELLGGGLAKAVQRFGQQKSIYVYKMRDILQRKRKERPLFVRRREFTRNCKLERKSYGIQFTTAERADLSPLSEITRSRHSGKSVLRERCGNRTQHKMTPTSGRHPILPCP